MHENMEVFYPPQIHWRWSNKREVPKKRSVVFFPKEGIAHSVPCTDQTRNLGVVITALTNWANQPFIPAHAPKKEQFLIDKTMVCAKEEGKVWTRISYN